jgi:glycine C-acetyltransferase/8-amino-7-oxononanoate synthase
MDVFAGTGYLGLQSRPEVIQAASNCLAQYGVSSTIPRGGLGEHPVYDELENQAAAFFGAEKVSTFASGYLGPAFLTQATATLFDVIFIDSDAHFSLWDAAQATNKPIFVFHHLDPSDLERQLDLHLAVHERPLVLTDGIFPISGEVAPLDACLPLVKPRKGLIYVDDAHAGGVLGADGRGTAEFLGIEDESLRSCFTLSKAFGAGGGLIHGSRAWVEALEKDSRINAGSTAIPLVVAAAAAEALRIARTEPELRQQLLKNSETARAGLGRLGLKLVDTTTPILCIPSQPGLALPMLRDRLFEADIAVEFVQQYTSAPPGGALRIAIFATHTEEQIDRLIAEMCRLL